MSVMKFTPQKFLDGAKALAGVVEFPHAGYYAPDLLPHMVTSISKRLAKGDKSALSPYELAFFLLTWNRILRCWGQDTEGRGSRIGELSTEERIALAASLKKSFGSQLGTLVFTYRAELIEKFKDQDTRKGVYQKGSAFYRYFQQSLPKMNTIFMMGSNADEFVLSTQDFVLLQSSIAILNLGGFLPATKGKELTDFYRGQPEHDDWRLLLAAEYTWQVFATYSCNKYLNNIR